MFLEKHIRMISEGTCETDDAENSQEEIKF